MSIMIVSKIYKVNVEMAVSFKLLPLWSLETFYTYQNKQPSLNSKFWVQRKRERTVVYWKFFFVNIM